MMNATGGVFKKMLTAASSGSQRSKAAFSVKIEAPQSICSSLNSNFHMHILHRGEIGLRVATSGSPHNQICTELGRFEIFSVRRFFAREKK
jgi:hypothetical protein